MIDWQSLATNRAAQDRISERVRLTLDGREYILPVLKSGPNARWLEMLDRETRALLAAIQDEKGGGEQIVAILSTQAMMPRLKAALYQYDWTHVLPPVEELDEQITDLDYVKALLEVWAAAHPLVVVGLEWIAAILKFSSSEPTNSPPRRTGGRRKKSASN